MRAYPLRERLVELAMLALHRSGRRLEALELFSATRLRLAEETGLDPRPELERLHRSILDGSAGGAVPAAGDARPGLPRRVLAPFVGRQRDLAELPAVLKEHPVVTLIGAPGSGKTRLALELAAGLAPRFPDGVALVPLDTVPDGRGVAAAVLAVVEPAGDPREDVVRTLGGREALLVLDNCEHVAAACAQLVEQLTGAGPRLRVLATSQVPLGVALERVYGVGPLSVPLDDSVGAVTESEAGRLLVDRAVAADPGFALTAASAAQVARVCRAVDGLPLALELAAGRLRAFSVGQVAQRLDHQLEVLAGRYEHTRHGSLRAAIDWSYELLTERERTVFARLAVFLGGFTLEAAEGVVADGALSKAMVMDTLGALVERSLVVAEHRDDPPGHVRYRLLEALRQYASRRLGSSGSADAVRDRHARYYAALAEQAYRDRRGPDRSRWVRWLGEEYPNLRTAMAWLRSTGDEELKLRYACALPWFWRRFATREALDWLREVLAVSPDAGPAAGDWLRALVGAGSLALRLSIDEARDYFQRAARLAHALADRPTEVKALSFMASTSVYLADVGGVSRYGDRAVALARTAGDPYLLARTLTARCLTHAHVGAPVPPERDDLAEALELFRALDDRLGMHEARMARAEAAFASGDIDAVRRSLAGVTAAEIADFPSTGTGPYWLCRSWLALHEGRLDEVRAHLGRAVGETTDQLAGPYAAQRIFGPAVDLAAGLALAEGQPGRAVTLHYAATAILTLAGTVPERPHVRWAREAALLDPAGYGSAAERGSRMRLADALAYAGLPTPR